MSQKGEMNELERATRAMELDQRGFESYLKQYAVTNPRPSRGWLTTTFMMTGVALMLLAAMRTGFQFFLSALVSANQFLGKYNFSQDTIAVFALVEMAVSVIGIEGTLMAFGMNKGHKNKKATVDERWVAGMAIAISVVAGLGQAIFLIQNLPEGVITTVEILLVVVTGIGVPFLAFFAAESFGALLAKGNDEYGLWVEGARKSWAGKELRKKLVSSVDAPEVQPQVSSNGNGRVHVELPGATQIINWFRERNGSLGDAQANTILAEYLRENGITVGKEQGQKLLTAMRVALLRERQKVGGPNGTQN